MIGGCVNKIKEDFTKSLMLVRDKCLKSNKDPSDSPTTSLMNDLITSIKLIHIEWSIPEDKEKYGKNEPFIDIVIARHHQDNFYLLLRQCINLVDNSTGAKKTICCGVLSYNLNNIRINSRQNQMILTVAQCFLRNKLSDDFKQGTFLFFPLIDMKFSRI
jgi:hypothetical protein